MNELAVGVTFVAKEDGTTEVWFHLPDSEGDVTEMSESFVAGVFENEPLARHAVINTGALAIKYNAMP